jgi:hypothetical protein
MTDPVVQESTVVPSLVLFSYFQLLDLLTTVGFIIHGVKEANPIVKFALTVAPTPLMGLALVKIAALAMGIYCWRLGRQKLLGRINVLFAILISWNMVALIAGSV